MAEETESQPENQTEKSEGSRLREMYEAELARNKELAQKLEVTQRDSAITAAGLNLTDIQRKAFEAAHEGDWNKDTVLQTATSLGFNSPSPEPQSQAIPQQEQEAIQRLQTVSAGVQGGINPPQDVFNSDLDSALDRAIVQGNDAPLRDFLQSTGWAEATRNRIRQG